MTIIIVLINIGLTLLSIKYPYYVKNFSFIASLAFAILVLLESMRRITRIIKSVKNAFPNETFVWVNVWNSIIFITLNLILFLNFMWQDYLTDEDHKVIDPDDKDKLRGL